MTMAASVFSSNSFDRNGRFSPCEIRGLELLTRPLSGLSGSFPICYQFCEQEDVEEEEE